MKKIIPVILVFVLLLFGYILLNRGNEHTSQGQSLSESSQTKTLIPDQEKLQDEIITMIKEAENAADVINQLCDTEQVIGTVDGVGVAMILNQYHDFDEVKKVLGKYYTEDAMRIYLRRSGMCEFNGNVGVIMADGEEAFVIDDNSRFEVVTDEVDSKKIKITMISENGNEKIYYYTVQLLDGTWKITDILTGE